MTQGSQSAQRTESDSGEDWGRVLICGGTGWATNGRKDRPKDAGKYDLLGPTILRSLCNIKVVNVLTGPSANYAVILDTYGSAYLIGAFPASGYGSGPISEMDPIKLTPASIGAASPGTRFVTGACARSHCVLVDDAGGVWGCGINVVGQLGLPASSMVGEFRQIRGPWHGILGVSVGHAFTLFLTTEGRVYAAGSSEYGQLGNGRTGERLLKAGKVAFDVESKPVLIAGLQDKRIMKIASGSSHSLAIDEHGHVYAWGNNGYAKLGLGDQEDRLTPTLVPQFAGTSKHTTAKSVLCGPTSSVVIDRHDKFMMAGKWKVSGEGGVGLPYTMFKPIQDLTSIKVIAATLGGCTHFVTTPSGDDDATTTIGFAQGALYGELGLGAGKALSSTRPVVLAPLEGCNVIDVCAGAFFSLFIAKPNEALEQIPIYPDAVPSYTGCAECFEYRPDHDPIMCGKCEEGYHLECASPPLEEIPEGEWFCQECEQEGTGGLHEPFRSSTTWNQAKKPGGKTQVEVDKSARSKSSRRSLADDDMRSTASQSSSKRAKVR